MAEINSMLLAGYKLGGCATRLEKVGDKFHPKCFDVFGPKAIACINGVVPALQTRCIEIRTERAPYNSRKPKRPIAEYDWQRIRDDLFVLALENGPEWVAAASRRDLGNDLSGRDYELWQPIMAIAEYFERCGLPGLVECIEETAAQIISEASELRTPEADEVLLRVLEEFLMEGFLLDESSGVRVYFPTPSEILKKCKERLPSVFWNFTPQGVGRRLRAYGLKSSKSNKRREYKESLEKLREILERYRID